MTISDEGHCGTAKAVYRLQREVTAGVPDHWGQRETQGKAKRSLAGYMRSVPILPGLPSWTPTPVSHDALADLELASELLLLDNVLNTSLDNFDGMWRRAEDYPDLDWTNNGCSDPTPGNTVTGSHFGCVRHDFLYRNQKRIDAQFDLDGELLTKNGEFKSLADDVLGDDIGGFRGWATHAGLLVGGSNAFYKPWDVSDWKRTADEWGPYGDPRSAIVPSGPGTRGSW